jgi:hypothetical protein
MIFKKCISLILVAVMLVSNAGLAFSVHFCGGKVASVSSVFHSGKVCKMEKQVVKKTCCTKKIAEQHKKCCSDKKVSLKAKSDHGIVKNVSFQLEIPFHHNYSWKPFYEAPAVFYTNKEPARYYCDAHSPPLFKLYSRYILYA